ncbi:oxaloacetate tautomerase FAHD1, mitochondrial-like [Asterias amurensis]|uniref:oxaloacetate tautomerase FAHD1, mitochondrial-like n=1 Tax=Asterias amurensis TaxID=7602 RepID=UPI003AB57E46
MAGSMTLHRFVEKGRKIVGVGLNYRQLAKEFNMSLPNEPLIFLKPTSCYLEEGNGALIRAPPGCKGLYYEVELGIVIGKKGFKIPAASAMDHVGGYALALDMTSVDLLLPLQKIGHPWAIAKAFDTALPIGKFIDKAEIPDPHNLRMWLELNGELKQDANTSDLVFKVPEMISHITRYMTLDEGDLILTGSPPNIHPVNEGDVITCGIGDKYKMAFDVGPHL